jgi:hypothetical protein
VDVIIPIHERRQFFLATFIRRAAIYDSETLRGKYRSPTAAHTDARVADIQATEAYYKARGYLM